MPIYEYQCDKCHHHLEALQKIADKPLRECPECGKHTLKRLVSAPMFRLAGSGWYETDFKSDKETKRNLAGREDASTSESTAATDASSAKSETKTEAKPDKTERKPVASRPAARTAAAKAPAKGAKKSPARKPVPRKAARKR